MKHMTEGLETDDWEAGTAPATTTTGTPQHLAGLAAIAADASVAAAIGLARRAGRPLALSETGLPAELTADTAALARQILCHAVTEAMAGAGVDGRVVVRLVWLAPACELRVHTFAGHGAALTGRDPSIVHGRLAERVRSAGGRYVATPTAAGYLTRAVLPVAALTPHAEFATSAPCAEFAALTPYAEFAASAPSAASAAQPDAHAEAA